MLVKYKKELAEGGETYIRIKVRPSAGKTEIKDVLKVDDEDVLKIDLAAPPVNNKANIELVNFLAKKLTVSKTDIKIISGASNKFKLVKIKK